jgi:hypothetical protein
MPGELMEISLVGCDFSSGSGGTTVALTRWSVPQCSTEQLQAFLRNRGRQRRTGRQRERGETRTNRKSTFNLKLKCKILFKLGNYYYYGVASRPPIRSTYSIWWLLY